MQRYVKSLVQNALKKTNVGLVSQQTLDSLLQLRTDLGAILEMGSPKLQTLAALVDQSPAQLKQDLFVLSELNFKRNGFFVEFGATDGKELSNTYLLESQFGWNGILAEPAIVWHEALRSNRKCAISTDCVWTESGKTLTFTEADSAVFSTISSFQNADQHRTTRQASKSYSVNTITLNDLLASNNAPQHIDYLSIDTEGSEFEILNALDFDRYKISVITCEHNFTSLRGAIFELLTSKGYVRKFTGLSQWDDWYVLGK